MFDDLFTEFLLRTYTPEYVELINSARHALFEYGYSLVEANLYKTSTDDSDIDIHSSKMLMEQCIKDGFTQVFSMLGIRSYLTRVQEMDCVLRAFRSIEESTDHKTIVDTLNQEAKDSQEKIIDLLFVFTTDPIIHECALHIELSDPDIMFGRLYDFHMGAYVDTYDNSTDERVDKEKLFKVLNFIEQNPQTIVAKLYAEKNLSVNKDFSYYIQENYNELLKFYPTFPDRVPVEFLGFALLASVPFFEVSGLLKTTITKFYNDLVFTTKTNVGVDRIMEKLQYQETQVMGGGVPNV